LSNTPTCTDVISLDSVVYAAAPHGKTRYNMCSKREAEDKSSGEAGVFLTYIELLQQQEERLAAGEEALEISAVEGRLRPPHRGQCADR
jgi:hypothetical protein